MKKRIISLSCLLILILIFVPSIVALASGYAKDSSKDQALTIDGETFELSVGEEIEFEDKFMPYVLPDTNFTYTIENEEVAYVNKALNKLIALKAGETSVTVENEDYSSQITVSVKLEDLNPDASFDSIPEGSRWTTSNQNIAGWTLYTGGAVVGSDQVVELYTDPETGNNMIHYYHPTQAYANLYHDLTDMEGGQYYVTADIKGTGVLNNNCFIRLNLNSEYGSTQTERLSGSWDMGTFTSPVFRVADGANLRLELYFANNVGDVYFDNIHVYRVITLDHTSFMVANNVEKMAIGEKTNIICSTVPESVVDFEYTYKSSNEEIVTVSKTGEITAVADGVASITVTDVVGGYSREVLVVVGQENGITASVNNGEVVAVKEDSSNIIKVTSNDSSDFVVYTYSDAMYGDYYINENNEIVYNPAADYYLDSNATDSFEVLAYDINKGYAIVKVEISILPVADEVSVVDYWHTAEKNGKLEWTATKDGQYDHQIYLDYTSGAASAVFGGGYLQVQSYDVEALYPAIKTNNMGDDGNAQKAYRKAKADLYNQIVGTSIDGKLTITTENGGTVEILYDGHVQEVKDRYFSSQNKIIYGVVYNYTAPKDFVGYDHFDMKITNGDTEVVFTNTVYVIPGVEDFKFDELDYSGVYLLSKSEWLDEVKAGYEANDPYITKWVEYYEAQYTRFIPTANPAESRTAMEQLAILYQVTSNKDYFDKCWQQLEAVVRDETYGDGSTKRLSWGKDSNGFLDAAMVTYSVAFAYNYLKDDLTAEQQRIVVKALYEEGFYYFETLNNVNVLLHGNNHCLLVCGNLAVAGLAVMSYDGELDVKVPTGAGGALEDAKVDVRTMAANTVRTAYKFLQTGLVHYSPTGGFPEGPSYSIYAHRNMVNLLATMYNLYGMDSSAFDLNSISGITEYINYPLYTSTPNYETFYYTEADYSNNQPALLWYTRIDEDNTNAAVLTLLAHENEQYNIQNLLWYQPGLFDKVNLHNMENKDMLLENHEIATFRSEFGDEMAMFAGLKGVDDHTNNFSHKNLDSGTFEIYALGERFIGNYSNETYNTNVPDGYWDYDYQRWTYYKKGAQGQNTLVIDPDEAPVLTQDPYENAPITRFESDASSGISVVDLSRVYKAQALSVTRGLKVFNNRQYVMVQDEFVLREPSTLYWSAHTEARVDILNDKLARLTLNNKSIYVMITSELGTFTKMSGNTPLPSTIGYFENLNNDGVTKLVIELNDVVTGTLSVVFMPTLEAMEEFANYEVKPIDSWTLDGNTALPEITANDISFDLDPAKDFGQGYLYEFNPYQYNYLVYLARGTKAVPNFKVTYDETKYELKINKSNLLNNISTVTLTDKITGESRTYNYKFVADVMNRAEEFADYQVVEVANVSGNPNANLLIDGNNSTSVKAIEVQEFVFELSDVKEITDILIRFNGGAMNTYYFDIYYSEDGTTYSNAYFAGQNANNIGDEVYALGYFKAKYIKVIVYGNNNDDKVDVAEVRLLNNGTIPTDDKNTPNNTMWIIIGSVVGGVVLIGAGVTVFIILKRRKKNNG